MPRYHLINDIVKSGAMFYLPDDGSVSFTATKKSVLTETEAEYPYIDMKYNKYRLVIGETTTNYDTLDDLLEDLAENHPELYALTK